MAAGLHHVSLGTRDMEKALAFYDPVMTTLGLKRVANGERPTPEGVDYSNEDAWNGKFAAAAAPGTAALVAFDTAYARYRDAATALSEDTFGVDPQTGKPRIGVRLLDGAGIHHFDEHRPQIDEWLSKRNSA